MEDVSKPKRIYLDQAAATPVHPEVFEAMEPYFTVQYGNPSATHAEGRQARRAIETARESMARILGARSNDVVWTGSGTEANNLAMYGYLQALMATTGQSLDTLEVITTAVEHPSILEPLEHLATQGLTLKYAPLTADGRIDRAAFTKLLSERTALVTFAYVNSEIGTVEDVKKISRRVRLFNQAHGTNIKIHLDAAQAPLWLPCSLSQLGVDLIALDAGKCYGPKGVGLLAYKHGVNLHGQIRGGGQERELRAGTENTPLIVGAAEAFVRAQADHEARAERVAAVRDHAIAALTAIAGVHLNGSETDRVANNVNVSIDGVEAEFAAVTLDVAGIACSTKSACGSGKGPGSHVVRTITGSGERATTALRFTLSEDTTKGEIDQLVTVLKAHIEKTRTFKDSFSN